MQITLSSDALWAMLQSLSPDAKRWLDEKLIESSKEEERLTPYTMEEINARIERSRANIKAGRVLTAEEADKEVKEALPWLRTRPADRTFPCIYAKILDTLSRPRLSGHLGTPLVATSAPSWWPPRPPLGGHQDTDKAGSRRIN